MNHSRTAHAAAAEPFAKAPDRPGDRPGDQAARLRALIRGAPGPTNGSPRADAAMHRNPIARPEPDRPAPPAAAAPRVLTVASGKGGVGKTNLCVNLAVAMARSGVRTVLLDGDLGLANADVLCGINTSSHLGQVLDGSRALLDASVEAPGGFRLVSGAAGVTRLADMSAADRERLVDSIPSLGGRTDLVLIDCGAGIGTGVLSFVRRADVSLVLTTPEPTAIADAYALIKSVVRRTPAAGLARTRHNAALVVNQVRGPDEALAVHRRINAVTERFLQTTVPLAGWVRRDDAVVTAVRERSPLLVSSPRARASEDVRTLAAHLRGIVGVTSPADVRRRGLLDRLLGRGRGRGAAGSKPATGSG